MLAAQLGRYALVSLGLAALTACGTEESDPLDGFRVGDGSGDGVGGSDGDGVVVDGEKVVPDQVISQTPDKTLQQVIDGLKDPHKNVYKIIIDGNQTIPVNLKIGGEGREFKGLILEVRGESPLKLINNTADPIITVAGNSRVIINGCSSDKVAGESCPVLGGLILASVDAGTAIQVENGSHVTVNNTQFSGVSTSVNVDDKAGYTGYQNVHYNISGNAIVVGSESTAHIEQAVMLSGNNASGSAILAEASARLAIISSSAVWDSQAPVISGMTDQAALIGNIIYLSQDGGLVDLVVNGAKDEHGRRIPNVVQSNLFADNALGAADTAFINISGPVSFTHNTIANNSVIPGSEAETGSGASVVAADHRVTIKNNVFASNTGIGKIYQDGDSQVSYTVYDGKNDGEKPTATDSVEEDDLALFDYNAICKNEDIFNGGKNPNITVKPNAYETDEVENSCVEGAGDPDAHYNDPDANHSTSGISGGPERPLYEAGRDRLAAVLNALNPNEN